MLLEEPNFNCHHCYKLKRDSGYSPQCTTSAGCPVPADLAADPAVNEFLSRYRFARKLYEINEIEFILERTLHDLGLYDELSFLTELEVLFAEEQQKETQRKGKK